VPRPRLLVVTPSLGVGGAERHMLRILPALASAFGVELATLRSGGTLRADLPAGVPVHDIDSLGWITAARRLRRLVGRLRPELALSFQEAANVPLLLALRTLARPARPATAVSVQGAPSIVLADSRPRTRFRVSTAMRRLYPAADRVIVASAGVTQDLAAVSPGSVDRVRVIYNAGIDAAVTTGAAEPWDHRFLRDNAPLVVACGRLTDQKDYPTLLGALADLRARREARLIILGDGPLRGFLSRLSAELGLTQVVDLAGYAANPYPCMARARVFVLSSRSEGFGNVLAEALALGVPIVSTDCPHGPGEILDRGRYGTLVPPGDPAALAAAIEATLDDPDSPRRAAALGPARAAEFTAERSGAAYVALLEEMLARRPGSDG